MKELNIRIKELRNQYGLTLKDVAERLGVRVATVQRYESGKIKNIKQETIAELAEIFHTAPEYLMGWEKVEESFLVTAHEKKVIKAYRKHPELQNGIDSILQIEKEDEKATINEDIAKEVSEELRKNLDTKLNTI